MIQALTLLIVATQLLSAISANPNIPASFRDNAVTVANYAIEVAEAELAKASAPAPVEEAPAPAPAPLPSFSGIKEPIPAPQPAPMPEVKKELTIVTDNARINQNGRYYDVYVRYTENGEQKAGVEVTISSDDQGYFNSNGTSGNPVTGVTRAGIGTKGDIGAHFQYMPQATGERTLTATAGGISTSIQSLGQVPVVQ